MLTRPLEHGNSIHVPHLPKKKGRLVAAAIALSFVGLLTGLFITFPQQFVHQIEISIFRQPAPYSNYSSAIRQRFPTDLTLIGRTGLSSPSSTIKADLGSIDMSSR